MNSFIKYICVFCGGIGLLTSTTACTNLDEETFSEITESTYKYEAGDATKVVGSSYANLRGFVGFNTYWKSARTRPYSLLTKPDGTMAVFSVVCIFIHGIPIKRM